MNCQVSEIKGLSMRLRLKTQWSGI